MLRRVVRGLTWKLLCLCGFRAMPIDCNNTSKNETAYVCKMHVMLKTNDVQQCCKRQTFQGITTIMRAYASFVFL
ncbi:hypothetical protein HMPREF1587_00127 [Bifidobacterium breve JCP7499]|nr:hypothetical protein HMPREF1587_00127 [Bifidobacterium breve JCP7499]